ncbi:VanZ family protein [Halalkalibacter alkalisediminis]|uniref:VanZ family protein n=1 Tax=Halalkalibacter alkalisediminis TaxID=935616 RepID=A0ABV6NI88_9BACI|nr:VanZ family protein [Halalkalibacter alkalisediminis]
MFVIDLKSKWCVIVLTLFYISLVLFRFIQEDLMGVILECHIILSLLLLVALSYNFDTWFYNTSGVVLLFIPIGVLIPLLLPKLKNVLTIVLILMFSLTIESVQYVTQLGVFDVDDIMLNSLGGLIGILVFSHLKRKRLFN